MPPTCCTPRINQGGRYEGAQSVRSGSTAHRHRVVTGLQAYTRLRDMWILRAMGRHSAKICTALLWLVSTVAASTDEDYTDLPAATDFYKAQAEDLETAPYQPNLALPYYRQLDDRAYWNKDLLLYKLMKSLQGGASGDENPNQKWGYDYLDSSWPDGLDVKGSDVKRWVTSLSPSPSSKASKAETARLQRKWKIKKGRGMPSLCYFKLCSFRRFR